ncbi:MAG: hypothetical protein M3N46_01565 [Actinomycetota bacterium]|nr:hypothetical protein [Actinomycetota bacterium]
MSIPSGLQTNPISVQDLEIWLPLLTCAAVAALRRQTWGRLITGATLAMFVLASISISVDQWFGSQAAPTDRINTHRGPDPVERAVADQSTVLIRRLSTPSEQDRVENCREHAGNHARRRADRPGIGEPMDDHDDQSSSEYDGSNERDDPC